MMMTQKYNNDNNNNNNINRINNENNTKKYNNENNNNTKPDKEIECKTKQNRHENSDHTQTVIRVLRSKNCKHY